MTHLPTLYSFRRCPYAIRARMALIYAGIEWDHHEISLRDKPAHMLEISPKGTVPVLMLPNGRVIDESIDIMLWALSEHDPDQWLPDMHRDDVFRLITQNDHDFKPLLDRYKYPNRYPDEPQNTLGIHARDQAIHIIDTLEQRISANGFLSGNRLTIADIAIFPFIRQFAHIDRIWFKNAPFSALKVWLEECLASQIFIEAFKKRTSSNQ